MNALAKSAKVLLIDVTEDVLVKDLAFKFLITEGTADNELPDNKYVKVIRPRVYIGIAPIDMTDPNGGRAEIQDFAPTKFLKQISILLKDRYVDGYDFPSLFNKSEKLFEIAYYSLERKLKIAEQASLNLIKAQLGDQIIGLTDRRLSGDRIEEDELTEKGMMIHQLEERFRKIAIPIIAEFKGINCEFSYSESGEIEFMFGKSQFDLKWKNIRVNYRLWIDKADLLTSKYEFSFRDGLMFIVNLPGFEQIIQSKARRLASVIG
jgi:hypothetical protein